MNIFVKAGIVVVGAYAVKRAVGFYCLSAARKEIVTVTREEINADLMMAEALDMPVENRLEFRKRLDQWELDAPRWTSREYLDRLITLQVEVRTALVVHRSKKP